MRLQLFGHHSVRRSMLIARATLPLILIVQGPSTVCRTSMVTVPARTRRRMVWIETIQQPLRLQSIHLLLGGGRMGVAPGGGGEEAGIKLMVVVHEVCVHVCVYGWMDRCLLVCEIGRGGEGIYFDLYKIHLSIYKRRNTRVYCW